ncbi:MAG: DUF3306 domain-containing protein [Pseudomonadota bacterium]
MPDHDDDRGFLLRWSRRKRGVQEPANAKSPAGKAFTPEPKDQATVASLDERDMTGHAVSTDHGVVDQEVVAQDGDVATTVEDEAAPHALENVDIDALDYESDYTEFMKEGVPEALKRKALRQLWRSDPILANIDGLNDYDDDFTDAALAVDVLKTVHKVGRGYLTDEDDEAEQLDETEELDVADGEGAALQEGAAERANASEADVDATDQTDGAAEVALSDDAEELSDEVPGEPDAPAVKT